MSIPERIKPTGLHDHLEIMTRAIFQAGLRWSMLEAKWPAFKRAFFDFDVNKIANFTSKDVDRIASDEAIIRSQKKVQGTVKNAQVLIELDRQFNGIEHYLHSFSSYEELAADIRKRFAFMGELNVYYYLFRIGEQVPPFEDWIKTVPGEHPRMREMVELAREQDSAPRK